MKKKGISEIVAVVIVILLVIIATGIVWGVVRNLIQNKTEGVTSCFDAGFSSKVSFNNDYTCYNSTSHEVQFSISIGDIILDKVTVTISAGGSSKSFNLESNSTSIAGLVTYPLRNTTVKMPDKDSGLTYIATDILEAPDWIKIAPLVGGKQCDATDTIYNIYDCSLFSD